MGTIRPPKLLKTRESEHGGGYRGAGMIDGLDETAVRMDAGSGLMSLSVRTKLSCGEEV